jgi:mono/diheme cytochrome c family protein
MNAPQTAPVLERLVDPLAAIGSLSQALCHTGLAAIYVALLAAACRAAEPTPGEELFRTHCADCHGAAGEGTADNYPRPLVGERSPAQLARFISQSMPPDAAGSVSGADADQVAKFVYDAFYSKDAQARRRPPRIELGHLTNRQLQHSIGDLFLAFRQSVPWTDQRGLQGQYVSIAANGDGKLQLTRVDPQVKFDFGKASPAPDKIEPAEFAISWIGSLHAPETADYEFIVRSENSVKLHVADLKTPLIDAWIKSGDETEFRGTVHLMGGRVYPVQLYFTKAGQGVAKTEQLRARVAAATVALEWKLPERVAEVVPTRRLSPQPEPETLLVSSAFPPDDRSTGVERGTSISPEWDRATTAAALEAAEYTVSRLGDLAGVAEASRENECACATSAGGSPNWLSVVR